MNIYLKSKSVIVEGCLYAPMFNEPYEEYHRRLLRHLPHIEYIPVLNPPTEWEDGRQVVEGVDYKKKDKFQCLFCMRHNFDTPSPHQCKGGFRKRGLIWEKCIVAIPIPSSPNQDNGREAEGILKTLTHDEIEKMFLQPSKEVSRTAIQELVGQLKGAISIIDMHGALNDFAQDRKVVYTSVLDLATKLLELERKQIYEAWDEGANGAMDTKTAPEFYNSKYNK